MGELNMESAAIMNGPASGVSDWRTAPARYRADMFLSPQAMENTDAFDTPIEGFGVNVTMLDTGLPIPLDLVSSSHVVVVEVRCDQSSAMERLQRLLAEAGGLTVIAAIADPTVADMRRLMRTGVADILPLPIKVGELAAALERIAGDLDRRTTQGGSIGKLVCAIKSHGGVGATTILTEIACLIAAKGGDEACLIDLDLQFGDAAFCLGSLPALNLKDLIDAGNRLDRSMLRSTLQKHKSGLSYIAAPNELVPLDLLTTEQAGKIVDLAAREFATLLIDLPHDWTNWSVSILAQCDLVLLVCDLSLSSLRQAKRQLEFLRQNDLGSVPVQVVMNKVMKGRFKSVRFDDAEKILGRPVAVSIADDPATVSSARDQGLLLSDADRRARVARDLAGLADSVISQPALVR